MSRATTSDDLEKLAAERDLYRRIELHQTHTAQSFASDVLPPVPLFPLLPAGCHGACADSGECACSHKTAPRAPRMPRARPSIWRQIVAFMKQPRFLR